MKKHNTGKVLTFLVSKNSFYEENQGKSVCHISKKEEK